MKVLYNTCAQCGWFELNGNHSFNCPECGVVHYWQAEAPINISEGDNK